jgi:hypothetical protein
MAQTFRYDLHFIIALFSLSYTLIARKQRGRDKIGVEILTDLRVLNFPESEKLVFGMLSLFLYVSVCMYVCVDVRLVSFLTVGRISSMFGTLGGIHPRAVPRGYKNSSSKKYGPQST